jgi:stromal membrane-associated protein
MEKQFEQRLSVLAELLKLPDNKECADCGAKGPKWASWSIGVFLCINCAGIHRSLGTHISKVRSATLDKWTDEQIDNMRNMGNARAKLIYEANVPAGYPRPREGAPSHTLESWIRAKYDKKQFMERGRTSHKEKREEPSYHQAQQRTSSPSTRKPSPPSPRQSRQQQQQQAPRQQQAPSKPLLSLVDEPAKPTASGQGVDLFGMLGGGQQTQQPFQHQQQQQQQQQAVGGGHDTSFFASLEAGQPQQQPQQKTLDKNSIMSLYHQPITPTMPMGMMNQQVSGQQQRAPNYNVHFMPATNMYIAPNGMPMVMSPTGQLVPATMAGGYPGAQQGWPMQGQMPGQQQQQQMQVGMTPYGYPQGY